MTELLSIVYDRTAFCLQCRNIMEQRGHTAAVTSDRSAITPLYLIVMAEFQ